MFQCTYHDPGIRGFNTELAEDDKYSMILLPLLQSAYDPESVGLALSRMMQTPTVHSLPIR